MAMRCWLFNQALFFIQNGSASSRFFYPLASLLFLFPDTVPGTAYPVASLKRGRASIIIFAHSKRHSYF